MARSSARLNTRHLWPTVPKRSPISFLATRVACHLWKIGRAEQWRSRDFGSDVSCATLSIVTPKIEFIVGMRRLLYIVYCFFVSCVSVCRSRRQRNRPTLATDVSYCGFQKGTKFGCLIEGALPYVITQIFRTGVPRGRQNAKDVKKNCYAFLVHGLTERHEIWHSDEHLCRASQLLF